MAAHPLPDIVKKAERLVTDLEVAVQGFSRYHKYSLGSEIRDQARRWVGEHRLVWEAANGPIPDGHVVVFLDGDKMNCTLDNLRCVPRGVLQYMNKTGLNETAGEARKAAILTAEVVTRTKQLERKMA